MDRGTAVTTRVIAGDDLVDQADRADVRAFLSRAGRLLRDREGLARVAPEDRAQAGLPLTWEEWRQNAAALLADAEAIAQDIPERELVAHLAADGAGPDAIDELTAKIAGRIEQDKQARADAERERKAGEQARVAAEQQRLGEERKQDLSEGRGLSA